MRRTCSKCGGKRAQAVRGERGGMSLEAAIALPIYFCVAVAIAFLLRAVQVHEQVQHAISQAALEIAGVSYVYGLSGALDVQREAEALAMRGGDRAEEVIKKSVQFEDWLSAGESAEVNRQLDSIAPALTDRVNGVLFSRFAESVTKKYLTGNAGYEEAGGAGSAGGGPAGLRGLNITGGEGGLNFIESTYLSNGGEDVKVRVRYEFRLPIPVEPLSRFGVTQQAYARAWLFGAGSNRTEDESYADEEDIWSLSNFERGDRIQAIFHANLPKNFPGISSYSDGTATLIKSLDTTAASYQSAAGIGKQIDAYVGNIRDYRGQPKPYGKDGIVIPPEDISNRRLVLVIPRNDISPEVSAEIDRCIRDALDQGVILQVERYAKKRVEGESNG